MIEQLVSLPLIGGISALVGLWCGVRLGFEAGPWQCYSERRRARKRIHVITNELDVVGKDCSEHRTVVTGGRGYPHALVWGAYDRLSRWE